MSVNKKRYQPHPNSCTKMHNHQEVQVLHSLLLTPKEYQCLNTHKHTSDMQIVCQSHWFYCFIYNTLIQLILKSFTNTLTASHTHVLHGLVVALTSWCCVTSKNFAPCSYYWTNHPCINATYSVLWKCFEFCFVMLLDSELWIILVRLIAHFIICELLGFPKIRYWVLPRMYLNYCSKTTHYAQKYLLNCFIVFLSYYSFKILSAKPLGCSSFLFA